MKRILILLALLSISYNVNGQKSYSIDALVKDSTGQLLIGVNIWLVFDRDSFHTVTDNSGHFEFRQIPASAFSIKATMLGYTPFNKSFSFPSENSNIQIPTIYLSLKPNLLREVIIKRKISPITLKEDTIEYTINQYKLRENAQIDDLLKRLPGIEVDKQGNIKFMGQPINKIKVNGQEFVVTNVQDIFRLIPLEALEKVQVIDDYGKMAELTGRNSGTAFKVLNLETKKNLNKRSNLKIEAGMGSADRYLGDILASSIDNKRQIIVNGRSNNNIPGPGDTRYNKGIFLYRNHLTDWLYTNGGIFIEQGDHKEKSYSNVVMQTYDGTINLVNNNINSTKYNNYNFTEALSLNTKQNILKIQLIGQRKTQSDNNISTANQTGTQHIDQSITDLTTSIIPAASVNIYGAHHFRKEGELLALGFNFNYNGNSNDHNITNNTIYYKADSTQVKDSLLKQLINKRSNVQSILLELSYIKPYSTTASLEIRYTLSSNKNTFKQITHWENDEGKMKIVDSLSNKYSFLQVEQKIGLNYKKNGNLIDYTLGGELYYASYSSNVSKWFIPNVNMLFKLDQTSQLNLRYEGHPTYPGYQQLRPLPDRSNPLFPIIGNPTLKAGLTNTFSLDYRYTSTSIFFVSLSANFLSSQTVTNTVLTPDTLNTLKQETRYLNANGIYSYSGNYAWSRPFFDSKLQLFIEGNANFNNNIFYLQNVKNYSQNVTLTQSLRTGIYQKWIELNTGASYTLNHTNYSDKEVATVNIHTWMINLNTKFFAGPSWSLWLDVNKQFNTGYAANVSANPTDLTATIEKTFLKNKLSFRLQGFNLLNQNTGISQTISANTTTQTRTNQLGRYILLSAILDLKKTKK